MRSCEAWFTRSLPLLSVCLSSCFVCVESGLWIAVFSRFSVCFQQARDPIDLCGPTPAASTTQSGWPGLKTGAGLCPYTEGSQVPLRAGPWEAHRWKEEGQWEVNFLAQWPWHVSLTGIRYLSEGKVAGMRRKWEQGGSLGLAKGC